MESSLDQKQRAVGHGSTGCFPVGCPRAWLQWTGISFCLQAVLSLPQHIPRRQGGKRKNKTARAKGHHDLNFCSCEEMPSGE